MPRKKTSKRSKKDESRTSELVERLNEAGAGRAMLMVGAIGAGVALVLLGIGMLESRASALIATPPDETSFAWPVVVHLEAEDGARAWPPEDVQQQLLELAHARVAQDPDPLSRQALERIGTDLRRSGLLEEIRAVRRRAGGTIEIIGRWRLPAAAVRHEGRDLLIGPGAELLPVASDPGALEQRVILGAAFNPPQTERGELVYGEAWPGEDVPAGLALLGVLRGQAYWDQVRAIDVSAQGLSSTLEIVTDKGTRVVWGASPGEFKPGEVDTRRKLDHLRALHERYGRIDAGQNRVTVFYEYTDVDRSASGGGG